MKSCSWHAVGIGAKWAELKVRLRHLWI